MLCFLFVGFLLFWGFVFIVTTTLVAIGKSENDGLEEQSDGIVDTYLQLLRIIRLPAVLSLIGILLTCKVSVVRNFKKSPANNLC